MTPTSQPIPALRALALRWEHPARRPERAAAGHRQLRLAILVAIVALLAVLASSVRADPLDQVVRAKLAPALPPGLDVARVYLPASLAALDVAPDAVAIEPPRELHPGRPSVKLTVRGRRSAWVPVAIGVATDVAFARRALAAGDVITGDDIAIERRALGDVIAAPTATLVGASVTTAIAAGAPIAARDVAMPPPLPRGTQVTVEIHRGAVHIHGAATLERAARPGEPAIARLAATRLVVHGTLVAPSTLVVGDSP